MEILNIVIQLIFDAIVIYTCGIKSLVYMVAGSLLAMGESSSRHTRSPEHGIA